MRENRRDRMPISSSYIGSGSRVSVFNRKAKVSFEKIKTVYGTELERLNLKRNKKNKTGTELTEKVKLEIRRKVKSIIRRNQRNEILNGIIAILITLGLLYLIIQFVSEN